MVGIFHVCYMIGVWYEVLGFLKQYYLSGDTPIEEIRNKDISARYLICLSYFALDAVYPVAFVLLMHFHSSDVLDRQEKALLSEHGEIAYQTVQKEVSNNYRKGVYIIHKFKYRVHDIIVITIIFSTPLEQEFHMLHFIAWCSSVGSNTVDIQ